MDTIQINNNIAQLVKDIGDDYNQIPDINTLLNSIYCAKNFSTNFTNFIKKKCGKDISNYNIKEKSEFLKNKFDALFDIEDSAAIISKERIFEINDYFLNSSQKHLINSPTPRTIKSFFSMSLEENKEKASKPISHLYRTRSTMYMICFALKLSYSESKEFFEKVYHDSFYSYYPEEIIMIYCLKSKQPYYFALNLIMQYQQNADKNTNTTPFFDTFTQALPLGGNEHTYYLDNLYNVQQEKIHNAIFLLLKQLSDMLGNNEYDENDRININRNIILGTLFDYEFDANNNNTDSDTYDIEYIRNYVSDILPNLSDLKQSRIKKIKTISKLRNIIILLHFGVYWYDLDSIHNCYEQDIMNLQLDYINDINSSLHNLNFTPMYAANIYDSIFIAASYAEDPIIELNDIINTINPVIKKG